MIISKKIILALAGLILALYIAGLLVLRADLQSMLTEDNKKPENIAVGDFVNLDFSAHWHVKIKQGKKCGVTFSAETDSAVKPKLENVDGTLYGSVESIVPQGDDRSVYAIVTAPAIKNIKAAGNAKITMEGFDTDSLKVILERGGDFKGKNNHFNYFSLKTTGETLLEITDNQETK